MEPARAARVTATRTASQTREDVLEVLEQEVHQVSVRTEVEWGEA